MVDFVAHLALGATTLLAWLGLGSVALVRGPRVGGAVLDLLNRVGVGALSFALLTFGAGWAGLLYRAAYLPVFVFATLAGFALAVKVARGVPRIRIARGRLRPRLMVG